MASELQQYYENFCRGHWAVQDSRGCPCRGSGWALSEVDTTHKCPVHYNGQQDPYNDDAPLEGDGLQDSIARHNATIEELAAVDPREAFVEEDFSYVPGDYDLPEEACRELNAEHNRQAEPWPDLRPNEDES